MEQAFQTVAKNGLQQDSEVDIYNNDFPDRIDLNRLNAGPRNEGCNC